MNKFLPLLLFVATTARAQQPSTPDSSVFLRIAKSVQGYRFDTTAAPDDAVTKTILQLRALRGGFNINEAIAFKIEEDRAKGDLTGEEAKRQLNYFTAGDGKRWLDNATVWIYRAHFNHKQLKSLVKFYKSEAGQKMSDAFPLIMVQTLAAAEKVKGMYPQK